MARYTHVQCIGFQIRTAMSGRLYKGERFASSPRELQRGEIINTQSVLRDISARVGLVKTAIGIAERNQNRDPTCLKVFMIPEFYFRGQGGGYELDYLIGGDIESEQKSLLGKLYNIAKNRKYEDWLFVFGTAVGKYHLATRRTERGTPVDRAYEGHFEAVNYCYIIEGGTRNPNRRYTKRTFRKRVRRHVSGASVTLPGVYVVVKQHKANSDFRERPFGEESIDVVYPSNYSGPDAFEQPIIIPVDNLRIGIEICLDHERQRLRNSGTRVHLQLVPSCGMSIKEDSISLELNGVVFNCDGSLHWNRPGAVRQLQVEDEPPQGGISYRDYRLRDLEKIRRNKVFEIDGFWPFVRVYRSCSLI